MRWSTRDEGCVSAPEADCYVRAQGADQVHKRVLKRGGVLCTVTAVLEPLHQYLPVPGLEEEHPGTVMWIFSRMYTS